MQYKNKIAQNCKNSVGILRDEYYVANRKILVERKNYVKKRNAVRMTAFRPKIKLITMLSITLYILIIVRVYN